MALFSWISKLSADSDGRKQTAQPHAEVPHFERDYNKLVDRLTAEHPYDEAMSLAVGGNYETTGTMQAEVLTELGLTNGMSVVDLGCGSGRTAVKIAQRFPNLEYLGIDVVDKFLDYARLKCPAKFRFIKSSAVNFPVKGSSVDMVIAFSVFTHLLHVESYLYLKDAHRILKPGGKVIFSFLEIEKHKHWKIFLDTAAVRAGPQRLEHLNEFIDRNTIAVWADALGCDWKIHECNLGQTVAVFTKIAAKPRLDSLDAPANRARRKPTEPIEEHVLSRPADKARPRRHSQSILMRVADQYAAYLDATISEEISPHDDMYVGHLDPYISVGRSTIDLICRAMIAADYDQINSILDLPCGGGRATRHLIPFFPNAEIYACDISKQKQDFVVQTFNAKPFSVAADFSLPASRRFDLIFVGSLLTHLNAVYFTGAMKFFIDALAKNGLLVVTTHGRRSIFHTNARAAPHLRSVMRNYDRSGFGFLKMQEETANGITVPYGATFTAPSWVVRATETIPEIRIVAFQEGAWADNQDVIVLQKRPIDSR